MVAATPGVHIGSVPWTVLVFLLVVVVVFRAWRKATKNAGAAVAAAVARAASEARASVEAELRATAASQSNVNVTVGDGYYSAETEVAARHLAKRLGELEPIERDRIAAILRADLERRPERPEGAASGAPEAWSVPASARGERA